MGIISLIVPLTVIFLIVLFLDSLILSTTFTISAFLTGNRAAVTLKSIALRSILISFISEIVGILSIFFLYFEPGRFSSPFSYYLSPKDYNTITLLFFPGLVTFALLWLAFRKYNLKWYLLLILVVTLTNMPWLTYFTSITKLPFHVTLEQSREISPSASNDLAKQVKIVIVEEQLINDPNSDFKQLRIRATASVPFKGHYEINTRLNTPNHVSWQYSDTAEMTYVNRKENTEIYGIDLEKGDNELFIDFPYVYKVQGKERINLRYMNNVRGSYGPYQFQITIESYQSPSGLIRLNALSEEYLTKQYEYTDFVKKIQ